LEKTDFYKDENVKTGSRKTSGVEFVFAISLHSALSQFEQKVLALTTEILDGRLDVAL